MGTVFKSYIDFVEFQVMGDTMALAAGCKLTDDRLGMGRGVAFLAGRNSFMLAGMALSAGDIAVFGPAAAQQGIDLLVAWAAILGRGVGWQGYFERHMGLVALFAGRVVLAFQVRSVAIEAGGEIAMASVAGRAVKGGMDGRVFLKLFQLTVMASGAGGGDGSGQSDLQRRVWVGMALQAIGQSEMGGTLVAAAARRDNLFIPWGMANMTPLAAKFVAVGHALGFNHSDNRGMAFDAITRGEPIWLRDRFGNGLLGAEAWPWQEEKKGD